MPAFAALRPGSQRHAKVGQHKHRSEWQAKDTRAFGWSAEDDAKPGGGGRHVFEEHDEEDRREEDRLRQRGPSEL